MPLIAELKRRNVIRVAIAYLAAAWLLIQVAETLFPVYGLTDAAIQRVVTVLAIAFIPSLIVAWVFELTPDGFKLDSQVAHDAARTAREHGRLDRIIIVMLALAVGYFAFDKFVLDPAEDANIAEEAAREARSEALSVSIGSRSIAVLAFDDMSANGDQEYFSDGIAEELLNLLSRIPELRVAGRTSAFSFKGKDATIAEIGEALNVAHVLEGSVRKAGNRIRITTQLIDAKTDTHLWSETYDRELGDIFAIQDDIATRVVDELKVKLLGTAPTVPTTEPEIYARYLEARHLFTFGGSDGVALAENLLLRVLEQDPNYAPAWVLLSEAYFSSTGSGEWSRHSSEEGYALQRQALINALRIDPDNAVAIMHRGWQIAFMEGDAKKGTAMMERALRLEPRNSEVLRAAGSHLRNLGRLEPAVELFRRSVALDPLCDGCLFNLAGILVLSHNYDEAEAVMRRRLELGFGGGYHTLGTILLLRGEPEAALQAIDRQPAPEPYWIAARVPVLYALGRREEALEGMAKLEREYADQAPVDIAVAHAFIGNVEDAFTWLEGLDLRDYRTRIRFVVRSLHPAFDALHGDSRWQKLLDAAGIGPDDVPDLEFAIPPL